MKQRSVWVVKKFDQDSNRYLFQAVCESFDAARQHVVDQRVALGVPRETAFGGWVEDTSTGSLYSPPMIPGWSVSEVSVIQFHPEPFVNFCSRCGAGHIVKARRELNYCDRCREVAGRERKRNAAAKMRAARKAEKS